MSMAPIACLMVLLRGVKSPIRSFNSCIPTYELIRRYLNLWAGEEEEEEVGEHKEAKELLRQYDTALASGKELFQREEGKTNAQMWEEWKDEISRICTRAESEFIPHCAQDEEDDEGKFLMEALDSAMSRVVAAARMGLCTWDDVNTWGKRAAEAVARWAPIAASLWEWAWSQELSFGPDPYAIGAFGFWGEVAAYAPSQLAVYEALRALKLRKGVVS